MLTSTRSGLLLALLYSAAFGIVASALLVRSGFPLDDSYIYQALARSIGERGALPAYQPSQPFAGATSLLWLGFQAARYRVFPAWDPVLFNLCVSWVLLVALGQLLWRLALLDGLSEKRRWIVAASPALCGNLLWLGILGMEHLLFLVLSLAAVVAWFEHGRSSALVAGVLAGMLVLVRPEAGLLRLLLLLASGGARPTRRDKAGFTLAWLAGPIAWIACNLAHTGSAMPSTLKGRAWMWFRAEGGPHSARAIGSFFGQWVKRLPELFSLHFTSMQIRLARIDGVFTETAVVLMLLCLVGAWSLFRAGWGLRLLLLWAGVDACAYLVLLPASGHGGRYQPLFLLLAFPCIFSGLIELAQYVWRDQPKLLVIVVMTLIVGSGISSLVTWRTISILGIAHIQDTHGAMAQWIARHLPAHERIASFDAGEIAYALARPVTDLGGLVDEDYLPYLESGRVPEYLEQNQVSYVVLPQPEKDRDGLHLLDGKKVRLVIQFCSNREPWETAYAFTAHAWRCQNLYFLDRAR